MPEQTGAGAENKGLKSRDWFLSYKTSSTIIDGRPVDMLHDFYIPALSLAVRYDRVAGYFRSSSLAAASQGFSAFVGRHGKMRLIVGADLEPGDVQAILNGDKQRLAAKLTGELEGSESWQDEIRNGVTLLAWMVARGYLEVRVAFRVHGKTGEPLTLDAVDDGYVHEKWFVLHDEYGNRLYGAGTLNESKTAFVLNAENIDVHCDWWGKTDRMRVDQAARDFENLWANRLPHMPVMSLPEAIRRKLIRLAGGINRPAEVDGTNAAFQVIKSPSAMERLKFAVLRDAPKMPGGRFVGMETAPVEPWPHQTVVVRRLVETWPYSYLLCDEVGLGKTIEAGLAFRSLYLSGLARRILIAAPAGLTRQWHRQMTSKVLLPFGLAQTTPNMAHEYILPAAEQRVAGSIYEPDLVIVSTGLLARRERAAALMSADSFDIALVDEAHAARRSNSTKGTAGYPDFGHLYVTIRDYLRKQARSLWLATATPMQLDPVEVCDLLALTNRAGAFQFDPTLTLQYYEILNQLVHGQEQGEYAWDFLRRAVQVVITQDPMLWRFFESSIIDGRLRATVRQWLQYGRIPKGRDRQLMFRLLFSASPLSRVMLRHTRQLLEIYRANGQLRQNLARRHILPVQGIKFNPLEQRIYDQLEEYCTGLARQVSKHGDKQSRQMTSFLLSFLRLRFASSLYAFRKTLQRRLRKVEATLQKQLVLETENTGEDSSLEDLVFHAEYEDDLVAETLLQNRTKSDLEWERARLKTMLNDMEDLTGDASKMKVLLQTLDQRKDRQTGRIKQTVIFTRFYDTLMDIVTRLLQADPHMPVGTYSGRGGQVFDPGTSQMINVDREEVKERFLRGEIDVLVCTDAAAEGLNLQTADLLVNFDLGWNPMKVEQRIGRIDRIGQKHRDIYVLNLCYAGSAEEVVYVRLLNRLAQANMIVGTQQISLLPVEQDEFRRLAEGTLTQEELMSRAEEKLELQRKYTQSMELYPEELYEIYKRMAKIDDQRPAPVNLPAIWEVLSRSLYLQALGCSVSEENAQPVLTISGVEGIPDGTVLTVSRSLYDEGLAGGGRRVHFASYGDPFFDAILKHLGNFEIPACVQRIAVPVTGLDGVEAVGYAAACYTANGDKKVQFIRAWSDLEGLQLAEDETLTEAEVEPLRQQLAQLARKEFEPCLAADRIERENIRAARLQEMLNFLIIKDLLKVRAGHAEEGALFWPVLREVDSRLGEREYIQIADLPGDVLRAFAGDLLFSCQVPGMGDKVLIRVPRIMIRTAIEAANRLAESLKKRKSELRVDTVLSRLQREADDRKRKL